MSVSKQLIDNVNKIKTTLNEISVYNLDVKTSLELYYELAKKVNEVINELSRFEGVVSDEVVEQNKKLIYLLGEGLKEQVGLKIDELITNGTMDSIINHKIFNELNTKIDDFKETLTNEINNTNTSLTDKLDTFKEEVDEQFNTITNKQSGIFNVNQLKCTNPNCQGECGKLKGDGIHDDTSAFEYIFSNIKVDEIIVPKATYKITRKLIIPSSLKITGMGCSYNGTVFKFFGCSGFEIKKEYVFASDFAVLCVNKPSFSLDIEKRNLGVIGIKFVYDDNFTSSSCNFENIIVNGFNVGIASYEEGSQTWAGAYREFKKVSLVENDINYFESGVTHDKFIGSNINRAFKHPIYCTTKGEPSNVEFIGTTIDGNRDVSTSIICDKNTKINISNSYIEYLDIKTNKDGVIRIDKSHVDNGVRVFGRGIIDLEKCWGDYKASYKCNFLTDRWYTNDITITEKEKYSAKITSDKANSLKFLAGYIPIENKLKIKDVQSVKLSYDYEIVSGSDVTNFNNKIGFRIVDTDSNTTYIPTQSIIDDFKFDGKTDGKFECYYNFNRLTDNEKIIKELMFDIKISDAENGDGNIDFSTTNLKINIKNVVFTIYSNSEIVSLNNVVNQSLIENDYNVKLSKKANLDRYDGIINGNSAVTINLNDNNFEGRLCMLSITKQGDTNTGLDIIALIYASQWGGTLSELKRTQRSTSSECSVTFSISNNILTIRNNNSFNCAYALRDCFKL